MFGGARFRTRIYELVGFAALALSVVTVVAMVLGSASEREISGIEKRYLPLVVLDRELAAASASVKLALENAAGSGEVAGLADADKQRDAFLRALQGGAATIAANGGD